MKIEALLKRFTRKKSKQIAVFAVVQPDAIYFSSSESLALPEHYPLANNTWPHALVNALLTAGAKGLSVHVVLHAQLFQSYQIDKPSIPQQEWSSALPFLLKDLITEKSSDVIADAYPLEGGNKAQAYVINKKVVLEASSLLESMGCSLESVVPEQEVWGRNNGELKNYLLVQRSKGSHFKLEAFVSERCIFQRTLRGVVAPITGVASTALQLDGLALELQRSIDYLSSHFKGMSLHQLKVCCDEEEHAELVQALGERLSVKVTPLVGEAEHIVSGQVLAEKAPFVPTDVINFYQEHLKPKKELMTLSTIAAVWSVVTVVMLCLFAWFQFQNIQYQQQIKQASQQNTQLTGQFGELKQKYATHLPSAEKVAASARLKKEIESQQASLAAIAKYDASRQLGYSGVMDGLAKLSRRDISLSEIEINEATLDVKGMARDANVIPTWIAQFKDEVSLTGRSFEQLTIGRDEQDIVTFELKSKRGAEK
ncbi:MSHA biogenesis protein MshI [Vibrio diazotrophicus]|uniref:MSHA biogenesis protein MshI n=1 Tax=Vibrio diazotrophicus TaxID=685 RepID=A0ABX4WBG2_VIBDI|nr:MSHA biogenesis protein MshI [Vibrio diazotrophicus]PNI00052.1 MSHA biogenesis protein MshI [Vibrio diazotrophicus]